MTLSFHATQHKHSGSRVLLALKFHHSAWWGNPTRCGDFSFGESKVYGAVTTSQCHRKSSRQGMVREVKCISQAVWLHASVNVTEVLETSFCLNIAGSQLRKVWAPTGLGYYSLNQISKSLAKEYF